MNATLRWDVISRALPKDAKSVLEVGCGQGAVAVRLARRYPTYVGLEPDSASRATATERLTALGNGTVLPGGAELLEPGATFDLVCAFEVIEHIEDDAAALAQWASLVAPGGMLLISTPGYQRLFGPWDELAGHFRRYEPAALGGLLEQAGLEEVVVRHYGFPIGHVLETGRRVVGRRRMPSASASHASEAEKLAELTASSGRLLQPDTRWKARAFRTAVAPFLPLQRRFPDKGTTLVAWGRRARP